ncbi:MAG: type VII toxin-antitoxin system HepT family RNase toxin [Candidatus Woesearchaeota archaeon]
MTLDDKILSKVSYIKECISKLKTYINSYDDSDEVYELAMERISEKIIESAISINKIVLEEEGIYSESYYDSFIKLSEANIFKKDFSKNLASTAGFRNRLAHDYMDINKEISIKTMSKLPRLYKKYLKGIIKYLEK